LTDERLGGVVDNLLAKAEKGDVKALDYLLTIGGYKQVAPTSVTVNNFIGDDPEPITVKSRVVDWGEVDQVCVFLSVSGPTTPEVISEQTKIPIPEIVRILDNNPNRFGVNGRSYFLKGQGA
jgi:hypothetical protein